MFALIVGILMIVWWSISYFKEQIQEIASEPIAISFHLAGEFITACSLIVAGIGLWMVQDWANWLYLVALGMLLYTVIVSPGYVIQRGQWPVAVLFGLLLVLGLFSLSIVI